MTTLTEGRHAGGFLVWEASRDYTRDTVTLVSWFSRAPGVKGAAVRPDPGGQRRRSDRILLGRSGP